MMLTAEPTIVEMPPQVSLMEAIRLAKSLGHSLGGFHDNKGVKVAQCEHCLDFVIVNSSDSLVISSIFRCDTPVTKRIKSEWTTEDQARYEQSCGDLNTVMKDRSFWNPNPGKAARKKRK